MAGVEMKQAREASPVERDKRHEMPRSRASGALIATLAVIVLLVLIFFGSHGLRDFDYDGTVFGIRWKLSLDCSVSHERRWTPVY
jgi:hypothetical protein